MGTKTKKIVAFNKNKLFLYVGIVFVATLAFVGVYQVTGGDLTKLAGAAVACGSNTAEPTLTIEKVDNQEVSISVAIKATDDCGLAKVEVAENLFKVQNGELVPDLILGNIDTITDESTFEKVYTFTKADYNLAGGKVKYEFKAVDVSGKETTVSTETLDI